MAMGLPLLLVSPEGEASQLIKKHKAGLWVPAGTPGSLADSVRNLAGDKGQCDALAMSSLAAARYIRKFKRGKCWMYFAGVCNDEAPTVFFDLDGTLIDSVHDVHLCLNSVLGEHGRKNYRSLWSPRSWGEVLKL